MILLPTIIKTKNQEAARQNLAVNRDKENNLAGILGNFQALEISGCSNGSKSQTTLIATMATIKKFLIGLRYISSLKQNFNKSAMETADINVANTNFHKINTIFKRLLSKKLV